MISRIIDLLRDYKAPNVFNSWTDQDPMDLRPISYSDRVHRLSLHFECTPKFLLIGEAPGYQGCKFSGVPFTNEALICAGNIPRIGTASRFTTRPLPWREPSATIVWGELHKHRIAADTIMWNAFAFHPHHPDQPYSNRTPTKQEIRSCASITRAVIEHCAGAHIIAVGRAAEDSLRRLGVCGGTLSPMSTVRHPSMGGATAFRAGLSLIVARAKL